MTTNRKTKQDEGTNVNFRAPRKLIEDFRVVVAREERTPSQDLRLYMAERIARDKAAA